MGSFLLDLFLKVAVMPQDVLSKKVRRRLDVSTIQSSPFPKVEGVESIEAGRGKQGTNQRTECEENVEIRKRGI